MIAHQSQFLPSTPTQTPTSSWDLWLDTAASYLHAGLPPEEFFFLSPEDQAARASDELALDYSRTPERQPLHASYDIPPAFRELGRLVAAHRSPHRWATLYRVLWRLTHGESRLLERHLDPDMHELHEMVRAVESDIRRLLTRTKFTAYTQHQGQTIRLAWAEPEHYTLAFASPKLVRRLNAEAEQDWSLLTRDACAHWIGHRLFYTPGLEREFTPTNAELPLLWEYEVGPQLA